MRDRAARIALTALVVCASASFANVTSAGATPSQAFTFDAAFTPNVLGASTNVSATMDFAPALGVPEPLSDVVAYGPAGLSIDVHDIATCEPAELETAGPSGCPARSRVGFGGGVGILEIAGAPVKEPYTLDFFLAPREHGRLAILIYVDAESPVAVHLVLTAKEVQGPRPFGFGLAVAIPPLATFPGAAGASVESSYASIGGANVAYYETIHGRRRLAHVKGVLAPATCPRGGFPFEAFVTFAGGATSTAAYASPCPSGSNP
jgi:hypothetical protein